MQNYYKPFSQYSKILQNWLVKRTIICTDNLKAIKALDVIIEGFLRFAMSSHHKIASSIKPGVADYIEHKSKQIVIAGHSVLLVKCGLYLWELITRDLVASFTYGARILVLNKTDRVVPVIPTLGTGILTSTVTAYVMSIYSL